jgi:predicted nucleic acid-binding protein
MTVIVDATPLIYLAAIGRFELLETLYRRIIIPTAVHDEVVVQGGGRWGATEAAAANWIDCRAVSDPAMMAAVLADLDPGEREVIALAEELCADIVIMDESSGRHELKRRGFTFIGTVGVLMLAKDRGLITTLKPELDRLRACGFHLSDHVYQSCLASVGE